MEKDEFEEDIQNFKATFIKRKQDSHSHVIGKLERISRFIFRLISKNPKIFFKKLLSLQDLPQNNEEEDLKLSKISEKIQEHLIILSRDPKYKEVIGPNENSFCLYDTLLLIITRRERVLCIIFEILKSLIAVILIVLINLGFKGYDRLMENKVLTGFLLLLSSCFFVAAEFLTLKITNFRNKIYLLRRQGLYLLVFDKLSISDSYFLSKADKNLVYRLFYSDSDSYCKNPRTLSGVPPMIILNLFLIFAVSCWQDSIFHWIQLSIVVRNVIGAILLIFKVYFLNIHKRSSLKSRKLLYEMICNFKAIRASNLTQKCMDIIENVTKMKSNIMKKVYFFNSALYLLSQFWFPYFAIFIPYFIALCFYPEYLQDNFDLKKNSKEGLLRFVPNTRQILSTLFISIFIEPFYRNLLEDLEASLESRYSQHLFDRFFNNDLVIEPPLGEAEHMELGGIIIDNCQVLERDKKDALEILNAIHENSDDEMKLRIESDFQFKDKASLKTASKTIKFTRELTMLNKKISFMSSNRKKKGEFPIRLRQIFSNLNMEISPGAKLCIYNNNQTESISGFMKILCGDTVISEGNLSVKGRCFYYNPNRMTFLTGSTIQDNIIYGAEYNADRYQQTLKLLNISFDAYLGRDFYQVTRRGENLKMDDRRMIMLARMLYSDSDIYIIEDLLNENNTLMVLSIIKNLFKNVLATQTIIYNSNLYQFMDLSTQILQFETKEKFWVFKTNQFREVYLTTKRTSRKHIDNGNQVILQSKIKNSLFITSAGYEEEIAIHKQLKTQMEQIEKFKQENKNIIDQLVHGILLTQKRRTEGTNLLELGQKKLTNFLVYYFKQLMKYSKKPTIVCFVSTIASSCFFYLFEWYIFFPENGTDADKWLAKSFSMKRIIMVVVFFILYSFFHWVKVVSYSYASKQTAFQMHLTTLTKLENASVKFIDKLSPPTVQNHISDETDDLYRQFSMVNLGLLDAFLDVQVCSILMAISNSIVLPLVWTMIGTIPGYLITDRITRGYRNLQKLQDHFLNKLSRFNYHLLGNLPNYRINKRLAKMDHTFAELNNSLVIVEREMQYVLRLLSIIIHCVEIYVILTFTSTLIINLLIPKMNFFNSDQLFYSYTFFLAFRLVSQMKSFRIFFYFKVAYVSSRFSKLVEFSQLLDKNQRVVESHTWKKLEFDESASIIFKNVGLTLGYRPVLKKITFKIKSLDRFGIVGVDGVGRKSIFEILTGAKTIDQNPKSRLSVFGLGLEEIDQKLQQQILLILPVSILLEGTIRSNIDPYKKSCDAKIIELLKIFNLESFFQQSAEDDAEILEIEQLSPINWIELGLLSEKQEGKESKKNPSPVPNKKSMLPASDKESKSHMTIDKLIDHEQEKSFLKVSQNNLGRHGHDKGMRCSTMYVKRSVLSKQESNSRLDQKQNKNNLQAKAIGRNSIGHDEPHSPDIVGEAFDFGRKICFIRLKNSTSRISAKKAFTQS